MITILLLAIIAQDPTAAKLNKARAEYKTTDEGLKRDVQKLFDEADKKAVEAGDTKMVVLIEEETEAYKRGDQWDFKSIDAKGLKSKREASRKAMTAAYQEASSAYTRARMRPEAKAVQAELDAYEKAESESLSRAANRAYDIFQAGTIWRGKRFTATNNSTTPFELIVEDRKGDRFKGTMIGNNKNKHAIEGQIHNGRIDWIVIRVLEGKNPGQPHTGFIKDDELVLTFKGMWGEMNVEGKTELKLQK